MSRVWALAHGQCVKILSWNPSCESVNECSCHLCFSYAVEIKYGMDIYIYSNAVMSNMKEGIIISAL